jgi:hypothetical protein
MSEQVDLELGAALAELIDTLNDSREEWLRINGSLIGFNEWCQSQVHGVK